MTKREVEKYLNKKELFSSAQVSRLGHGNNSDAFLVKDKSKKYTLRVGRKDSVSKNKFLNHYISLKFLEQEHINFAPHPIYFDKKNEILISTYVPGQPITHTGLALKELRLFLKQLYITTKLKYNNYIALCHKYKFKPQALETPITGIKKYGVDRFRYVKNNSKDKDIVRWIEPRLNESVLRHKKIKWNKNNLVFIHGDLTGANIVKSKGKVYFIDWELSRFSYSLTYGLSYMFIHFDFFADNQDKIIKIFAKHSGKDYKKLKQDVLADMQSTKVNDVIWAARMYTKLNKNKERGWKKYKKMTYQRMKEYEKMFKFKRS